MFERHCGCIIRSVFILDMYFGRFVEQKNILRHLANVVSYINNRIMRI